MKFLCDMMLGKLAKYLRMLGLDTIHARNTMTLNAYKNREDILFLTKRKKILGFRNTILITGERAKDQLREIKEIIGPYLDKEKFMTRCLACNIELENIKKEEVEGIVPEFVYYTYKEFKRCPSCKKIYWQGTHTNYMKKFIEETLEKDFGEI